MARRTEAGGRLITPKKLPPAFVVPLSGSFQPHFDGFVFKRAQSLKTCLYLRLPQKSLGSFCIFFSPRSVLPGLYVLRSDDSVLSRTSATQPLSCRVPVAHPALTLEDP